MTSYITTTDLGIRMDDDPILRTVSEPVTDFATVLPLIERMAFVLMEAGGRGLAAIQIGVPLRVLIVKQGRDYLPFINPVVTRTLNRFTAEFEGCLSVQKHNWRNVSRPAKCDATWQDMNGATYSVTLTGETARIFQHEFDHLNGVLIIDKEAA